jgi:Tol biopolymer transport system component
MWARVAIALGVAACGARVDNDADDGVDVDANGGTADAPTGSSDAPPTGPDAALGLWGTPSPIGPIATPSVQEDDGTLDSTETELLYASRPSGGVKDLYRLTRATPQDPWGAPAIVSQLNSGQTDQTPRLSADGLTVYFASSRNGTAGGDDIWTATRADRASPFGTPTRVAAVNSGQDERTFTPCGGNRYVMISFRTGNGDVYEGVMGQAPTLVASLSSGDNETGTFVTQDCLKLWFASNRDGDNDIFWAYRATVADPWILGGKVTELSTNGANESDPWVSADLRRMVFASDGDGELDQYLSTR